MPTYQTVKDYMPAAKKSMDAFVTQYKHPFLVLVDTPTFDDDEEDTPSFFTKAYISLDNPNATIGGGPMMNPDAMVLPVVKRTDLPTQKSTLASTVMVGRNEQNDVVLTYTGVSKYHFYIAAAPFKIDQYTITDNGSTNGTFVNMKKLQPSTRVPLFSGDKITLGSAIALRFYLSENFWKNLQYR